MIGARVIVVDDEPDLRNAVAEYLRDEAIDALAAASGAELDALLAERPADLVVLDINMPGEDGLSIARRLRVGTDMAIIMLTSRGEVVDRIVGLELGADDYLTKPFSSRELLARIRTVLRRTAAPRAAEPAAAAAQNDYADCIWVDVGEKRVRVDLSLVDLIEAARDYVVVHTAAANYILRHTMKALEGKLDPADFFRAHRSVFLRPEAVVEIAPLRRSTIATLRGGRKVAIAANRRRALAELIEAGGGR